jgi:hypothetical protein
MRGVEGVGARFCELSESFSSVNDGAGLVGEAGGVANGAANGAANVLRAVLLEAHMSSEVRVLPLKVVNVTQRAIHHSHGVPTTQRAKRRIVL